MSEGFRQGKVYVQDHFAGMVSENDEGYQFAYDLEYLKENLPAVSLTLPLREKPYQSHTLMPFFDGLIPEGWLLEQIIHNWKLNPRDRFGILLSVCRDCIGDVSVIPAEDVK